MDTKSDRPAADHELSLIRGGPFYRAQQATWLIRPGQWNIARRVIFAVAIGWLPLVVITAIFNHGALMSLLRDYRVHSRLLIAVPVLLIGEVLIESRFRLVARQFRVANLLEGPDLASMDESIKMLLRLRDSFLPELVILLILAVHTFTAGRGLIDSTPWLARPIGADLHLTMAGWYAILVGTTMFQFLLGLGLWRWLLWTIFAFKLSRLNLKLIATHPDEHGGLGFLGLTPLAFTPVVFAASTVIAATWRHEIIVGGATLMTFKLPAIVLVITIALVACAPLVFFMPRLAALRRQGILQYGALAQLQSTEFHAKWILNLAGHEAEFLDAPESSTLCDFGQNYERVAGLRPFPADREALIALAVSVALPMLPAVLAVVPLAVVLKSLLGALR